MLSLAYHKNDLRLSAPDSDSDENEQSARDYVYAQLSQTNNVLRPSKNNHHAPRPDPIVEIVSASDEEVSEYEEYSEYEDEVVPVEKERFLEESYLEEISSDSTQSSVGRRRRKTSLMSISSSVSKRRQEKENCPPSGERRGLEKILEDVHTSKNRRASTVSPFHPKSLQFAALERKESESDDTGDLSSPRPPSVLQRRTKKRVPEPVDPEPSFHSITNKLRDIELPSNSLTKDTTGETIGQDLSDTFTRLREMFPSPAVTSSHSLNPSQRKPARPARPVESPPPPPPEHQQPETEVEERIEPASRSLPKPTMSAQINRIMGKRKRKGRVAPPDDDDSKQTELSDLSGVEVETRRSPRHPSKQSSKRVQTSFPVSDADIGAQDSDVVMEDATSENGGNDFSNPSDIVGMDLDDEDSAPVPSGDSFEENETEPDVQPPKKKRSTRTTSRKRKQSESGDDLSQRKSSKRKQGNGKRQRQRSRQPSTLDSLASPHSQRGGSARRPRENLMSPPGTDRSLPKPKSRRVRESMTSIRTSSARSASSKRRLSSRKNSYNAAFDDLEDDVFDNLPEIPDSGPSMLDMTGDASDDVAPEPEPEPELEEESEPAPRPRRSSLRLREKSKGKPTKEKGGSKRSAKNKTKKSKSNKSKKSKSKSKSKSKAPPKRKGSKRRKSQSDDDTEEDICPPRKRVRLDVSTSQKRRNKEDVSEKIVCGQGSNDGLRKSKRVRFTRMAWWAGERVEHQKEIIESEEQAQELVGGAWTREHLTEGFKKKEVKRRKTSQKKNKKKRRSNRSPTPPGTPDRESDAEDGFDEHALILDLQQGEGECRRTQVFKRYPNVQYARLPGPGRLEGVKALEGSGYSLGFLKLPPGGVKNKECAMFPEIFHVLNAEDDSLVVSLYAVEHQPETRKLSRGDSFHISQNNDYSLENISKTRTAKLLFVLISAGSGDEELEMEMEMDMSMDMDMDE